VDEWRRLVESREAAIGGLRQDDFWERRARRFAFSMRGQADPFLGFLEPWLRPTATLIDVGAGTGRHAVPLAARLDWVTAVEPSQAMRSLIPETANLTIVAASWLDADVAQADLVISAHVLYPIAEPAPSLAKLEAAARERVFVLLREGENAHPAELLRREMAGPPAREPRFAELLAVLSEMGIEPEVARFGYPVFYRFESLEAALEDCRLRIGEAWDEPAGRRWLKGNLRPDADGSLVHDGGEMTAGVAHWRPTPSS